MATFSTFFKNKSVRIRIRHNRQKIERKLFEIEPKFFKNEKVTSNHPNAHRLNKIIIDSIKKYADKAYDFEIKGIEYSVKDLVQQQRVMLSACIHSYSKTLTFQTARKYLNVKNYVIDYGDIAISNITEKWCLDFISSLPLAQSTKHRTLKFLKAVLRKEGVAQRILDLKISSGFSVKVFLTQEEYDTICNLKLSGSLKLSRDIFRLQVLTWGNRIGDALCLRRSNIVGERIEFTEQKTGKFKSVGISKNLRELLNEYNSDYLIPIVSMEYTHPSEDFIFYKHLQVKTSQINKDLKIIAAMAQIDKNITTHVARNSFATWLDRGDVSIKNISEFLNHSKESTTKKYIEELRIKKHLDNIIDDLF